MEESLTDRKSASLSRMEMETSILGNADSREWDIVTSDPKYIRAFERKGWRAVAPADHWGAKRFKLPLRAIGIRSAKIVPRSAKQCAAHLVARTALAERKASRIDQTPTGKG
jgi:hypothetical protein